MACQSRGEAFFRAVADWKVWPESQSGRMGFDLASVLEIEVFSLSVRKRDSEVFFQCVALSATSVFEDPLI